MNVSAGQIARDSYIGGLLLSNASYHRLTSPPDSRTRKLSSGPGTVLIVGGELFNKGAQAMTYTVVSEISDRFPEKDICLMSTRDFERPADERDRYTFDILPWSPDVRLSYLRGGGPLRRNTEYTTHTLERVDEAIDSSECIIDINGYALSSQRGTRRSLLYLLNIMIARERGIPFYVFPQSIGPFDYGLPESPVMELLLKTYLPYPAWVFPREESGVETVRRYRKTNVRHGLDLVLTHDYDLKDVFHNPPEASVPAVPEHSVGIVPNMRVAERMSDEDFRTLYTEIVETLLGLDRHPVVIQHSIEDKPLCNEIAELVEDDVTVVTGDRQPFELEEIINQLDFLVGSRYHSVIHAYKRAVPAIVIGWAKKYRALLEVFEQADSVFDVRDAKSGVNIINTLEEKSKSYEKDSSILTSKLKQIQSQKSPFGVIQGDL